MQKKILLSSVLVILALPACEKLKEPPPPAPPPAAAAPAGGAAMAHGSAKAPAAGGGVSGKVLQAIPAASYTYLELETASGKKWAAVSAAKVKVGDTVNVTPATLMRKFTSKTLSRTFDEIYFGQLGAPGAAGAAGATTGRQQMTAAHSKVPPVKTLAIAKPLAKAAGATGRSVAEVYTESKALTGKKVSVRGKVAKVNTGIMGRNWLHLQDGTGSGKTADLTVTSAAVAALGDTVLVEGTVATNKNFGAGYAYDVIVEKATVKVETPAGK